MILGSCHCGAVTWEFTATPDGATACNCTVCRRYGALWIYHYDNEGVRVKGETSTYIRGSMIEFHFCTTCGCVTHWRSQLLEPGERRRLAVNVRLAEPDQVAALPIDHFDGLRSFTDLPRDGRCVVDYWS